MLPFRWAPYAIPADASRSPLHHRVELPGGFLTPASFHHAITTSNSGLTSPRVSSTSSSAPVFSLPLTPSLNGHPEEKQCLICGDRATGLHYGIVSCEGCKGFFKRSICNRRVYKCMKDRNCMMSRQKRNRCQYCRLLKCLQVGMNRKAIREDGMPGGRNKSIGPVKLSPDEINRIMSGEEYERDEYAGHPSNIKSPTSGSDGASPTFSPTSLNSNSSEHFDFAVSSLSHVHAAYYESVMRRSCGMVDSASTKESDAGRVESVPLLPEVEGLVAAEPDLEVTLPFKLPLEQPATHSDLFELLCKLMDRVLHREIIWAKRLPFSTKLTIKDATCLLEDSWLDAVLLATMRGHPTELYADLARVLAMYTPLEKEVRRFGHEGLEIMDMAGAVAISYKQLCVSSQEHLCIKVVNYLNPDKKVLAEPIMVETLRKQYYFVLHDHVQLNNNAGGDRFRDLLSLLPNIKILSRKVGGLSFECAPLLFKAVLHACGPHATP